MTKIGNESASVLDIKLFECGYEQTVAKKIFSFTPKDYYVVHLVVCGRGFLTTNNKTYKLKKGALFFIAPDEHPHYYPDQNEPWTYVWLGFSGATFTNNISLIEAISKHPVLYDDEAQSLKTVMMALFRSYNKTGVFDLYAMGYACQFLATLFKINKQEKAEISRINQHYNHACQYIDNNYPFQISIKDIAANVGVTPNYLSNIFQLTSGISTKTHLYNIRMAKAKSLLLETNFLVHEIAQKVGFLNPLYFSTAFKKCCGYSPATYRKNAN